MAEPRQLVDDNSRRMARQVRDRQWRFMRRVAEFETLWFCVWNKRQVPEAADEWRDGLIGGLEILEWIDRQHPDWFRKGEWNDERYAFPVTLTDAGRGALSEAARYDMEPVYGGLVEPGWQATPAPVSADAAPSPAPWNLVSSESPSGNGAFHLYVIDGNQRKIAALWGREEEKRANGKLICEARDGSA